MEGTNEILTVLDQIPDPAFLVRNGIIQQVNPSASRLLINAGSSATELLATGSQEYSKFREGYLALTLKLGAQLCSASVTRLNACSI